jgi:hypothetical protein
MLDAKTYRQRQNASGKPLDIRTVQEFTARRNELARSALASLQASLSHASYSAIQRFLANDYPKVVVSWR